jgi:hypothetical protein
MQAHAITNTLFIMVNVGRRCNPKTMTPRARSDNLYLIFPLQNMNDCK